MDSIGTTESLIDDVIGCGPFQVVLFFLGSIVVRSSAMLVIAVTVFTTYNPGWRCMDNVTTVVGHPNQTYTATATPGDNDTLDYTMGSCEAYKVCRVVEFNPESSTIVTEWRLLCDKEWVITFTLFVLMFGMLVGGLVGGQLADSFGRKKTLRAGIASAVFLQMISSFSVCWEMFVTIRFLIGMTSPITMQTSFLYLSEMMTSDWRATVKLLPSWQLIFVLVYLYIVAVKSWRKVEFFLFILQIFFSVCTLWVPESLRWLGVKEKTEEFNATARKMANYNKKTLPDEISVSSAREDSNLVANYKPYTMVDLLRRGYRLLTFYTTFVFFVLHAIYYGLTYGVVILLGDFYTNLLLMNILEIPLICIAVVAMRYLSRRWSSFLFIFMMSTFLFATGVSLLLFSQSQPSVAIVTTVLVSVAKGFSEGAISFMFARTGELYPTVARGLAIGLGTSISLTGGVIAPLMIPHRQEHLAGYILALGVVSLVCCFVSMLIPETKGKTLKETF